MYYQAESELGLNFLKTLPAAHNESLVFSPVSIALVLALVHTGALGNSKKQIENSLLNKANCNNCQFVNHFSNVYKNLQKGINGVEVNIANRLYLKRGSTAKRMFLSAISLNYGSEARALDFRTSDAMQKINGYVKSSTKGKIERIITCQDSIRSANGLLINAMSFKGGWEDGFPQLPGKQLFHKNEREGVLMGMLADNSIRGYSSDDVFQVLTLKYVDPRFQLSIFLPKRRNGLNDALKKLDNRRFENLLDNVKPTLVNTELPKFSVNYRLSLKNSLKAIGITEMFSDFADLSGIADKAKLSEGIHKSSIQLSESGTGTGCTFQDSPAASPGIGAGATPNGASTSIGCGATVAKTIRVLPIVRTGNPFQFKADHPFLFALTYLNHSIYMGVYRG
ncbi:hypothetical protein L5515_007054 [Caenorhabditis briggsae]|uniref:Serpin domain-containing protein n=1 Tax=Caenorhabditis briggsae TaxID=6238 RepID=A0AAE9F332_CAEBR|nr:hypothetical protein L5515_007054 [Caenorhabditis briggsae]